MPKQDSELSNVSLKLNSNQSLNPENAKNTQSPIRSLKKARFFRLCPIIADNSHANCLYIQSKNINMQRYVCNSENRNHLGILTAYRGGLEIGERP